MRPLNRLLALVLSLVLIAGGLLVILESIWNWTNSGFVWIKGQSWLSSFKTTPWSSAQVIAISIGVGILGLILLLLEVRPHSKRVASFKTDSGSFVLLRRSTEAHLRRRMEQAVPVSPIKVKIAPRALRWKVKVTAKAATSTKGALEAAASTELERLHAPHPRVQVRTTGARKVS